MTQRIPIAVPAVQLGASAAALYTVPTATVSTVGNLSFTNTSASPVPITVYNVPSGSTASASNQVVSAYTIAAGKTYVPPQLIGLNLAAGATIQALAGTAAVVNAQGGVYETSGS